MSVTLERSRLLPQQELLTDDVDLSSFMLTVNGVEVLDLSESIISGSVSRTIEGASTLQVTVQDADWSLARSGYLNSTPVDVQLDGLWFRLTGCDRQGDTIAVTFEDREIAVLRGFPKPGAPHKGYRTWDARKVSRLDVVKQVVSDVTEIRGGIQLITLGGSTPIKTSKDAPDAAAKAVARHPGFFPADAEITVKNHPATATQADNIDRVLSVGYSMKAPRKVLVVGVMVITQETVAGADEGNDPRAVGLFQQNKTNGWPATGDAETDAHAFFEKAISVNANFPSLAYTELAQAVQISGHPTAYAQWRTEAEHTVTRWLGSSGETQTAAATLLANDTSFQFVQGTQTQKTGIDGAGGKTFTREDDWSFVTRLAQEVQWRAFMVSGALYFVTDTDLLRAQPQMTITPSSDGVDQIDGSFAAGLQSIRKGHRVQHLNQQVTVTCRIGRWQAPPGSVVEIDDTGIFDGRWIVNTIERGLFTNGGTVTLARPQTPLPEAKAPEYLTTGGTAVFSPSTPGAGIVTSVLRDAIVAAAKKAVELKADFRYAQVRPMPAQLFGGTVPKLVDCSSFLTLVYKRAGADDPNGLGYNGSGNTGTLVANGVWTQKPQPGDAVFFGDSRSYPHHVAVYIGDGRVVNMGGPGEPIVETVAAVAAFLPLLGYMTFLDETPADAVHHR